MDINIIREVITVISFLAFVLIVAWAWSDSSRKGFSEAAQLPFQEDDSDGMKPVASHGNNRHQGRRA